MDRKGWISVLVAAMLLIGAQVAWARPADPFGQFGLEWKFTNQPDEMEEPSPTPMPNIEIELEGMVEVVGEDGSFVIAGHKVLVDPSTHFEPDRTAVVVGVWVEVKAVQLEDGSLLALEIEVEHSGQPDDNEVETFKFRGVVEAMQGTRLTVNGMVIDTSTAAIEGNLQVGAVVEVEATRTADGTLVAIEVEVKAEHQDDHAAQVEFQGTVEAIEGTIYIVVGVRVDASGATIEHGPIAVGDVVKVEGIEREDGSVAATHICKITPDEAAAEVEFTATVEAIDAAAGTISFDNGLTVLVNTSTLLDERHGVLEVGVEVKVKAIQQDDGSLLALRIKVLRERE